MRRALLAGVLLAVPLAGCSDVDTSPIDSGIPDASGPAAERSLPPATQHWKGLKAKCPELASGAARELGVAGAGAPTDSYATNAAMTAADCHWGSTDGHGTAVDARLDIWARQEAADAQWLTLTSVERAKLQVGDEGFISDDAGAVVVYTRSGNAVATVRLIAPTGKPDVAPLRQAASEITNDVLDDLVAG